jgi:hypothetical protein
MQAAFVGLHPRIKILERKMTDPKDTSRTTETDYPAPPVDPMDELQCDSCQ